MYFCFIYTTLALRSAISEAAVIGEGHREFGLEVTLAPATNVAEVIATVRNFGIQDINLLTLGTFLDTAPTERLSVVDEFGAVLYGSAFLSPLTSNRCFCTLHGSAATYAILES